MANKIDELLKNDRWKKEKLFTKKLSREEIKKQKDEEVERERLGTVSQYHGVNMEAFKTPASETQEKCENRRLGNTGPKPWFDKYSQGGNAKPRNRRREHPSGYHSCG